MSDQFDSLEQVSNPLDSVEEVLASHNWVFSRMNDHELMVQVAGKHCNYRLFFIWQADMSAMQFCCQYDMAVESRNYEAASTALMSMNENLWMGHFDMPRDNGIPSFRHTCLFRGMSGLSTEEHIEDIVDISLAQCERYYPVFFLLAQNGQLDIEGLTLALMENAGEA